MKAASPILSTLLATLVAARPRAGVQDEPLPETSRFTAFVVDEKGNPSVECWEIGNIVQDMQMTRADGSKATSHVLSLTSNPDWEGLEVVTWGSGYDVWPPASYSAKYEFDLSAPSLWNVKSGLIDLSVHVPIDIQSAAKDDVERHIFSEANGDDWFYFEDSSSSDEYSKFDIAPLQISTVSATDTEVLRLRYNTRPKHRVVHKGACSFTGIRTLGDSAVSEESARARSPLTVQVHIEDL